MTFATVAIALHNIEMQASWLLGRWSYKKVWTARHHHHHHHRSMSKPNITHKHETSGILSRVKRLLPNKVSNQPLVTNFEMYISFSHRQVVVYPWEYWSKFWFAVRMLFMSPTSWWFGKRSWNLFSSSWISAFVPTPELYCYYNINFIFKIGRFLISTNMKIMNKYSELCSRSWWNYSARKISISTPERLCSWSSVKNPLLARVDETNNGGFKWNSSAQTHSSWCIKTVHVHCVQFSCMLQK